MKFYDMLSKYNDDILKEIPYDININPRELKNINSTTDTLDEIWKMAKNMCKKYIKNDWIKNLGIDENELLEDIKFYSILTIYISIKNKNIDSWSIESLLKEYYDEKTDGEEEDKIIKSFKEILENWANIYGENLNNIDNYDELLIYMEPLIFLKVMSNWEKCPYNKKYSEGMTFKQVDEFYKVLSKLINGCNENDELDKIAKEYTIERLFNVSFLYSLSEYIQGKFQKNIEKTDRFIRFLKCANWVLEIKGAVIKYEEEITIDKADLEDLIDDKRDIDNILANMKYIKTIESSDESIEEIVKKILALDVKDIEDIEDEDKKKEKQKDVKYFQELVFDVDMGYASFELDKYEMMKSPYCGVKYNEAKRLLVLSEIVSIPMVFYRNKYIKLINEEYERRLNDELWYYRLRASLLYLNSYMIPILLKMYYCLIYLHTKIIHKNEDYIKSLLKDYMEKNLDRYEKFTLNERVDFKDDFTKETKEAFEVNITEIIYNYNYQREFINEKTGLKNIFNEIQNFLNQETSYFITRGDDKLYVDNFPHNGKYGTYKSKRRKNKI